MGTSNNSTSKVAGVDGARQAVRAAAVTNIVGRILVFTAALCGIRLYTATPARLCNCRFHDVARQEIMARWQSGYAADCNSVYAGSIPTLASILIEGIALAY